MTSGVPNPFAGLTAAHRELPDKIKAKRYLLLSIAWDHNTTPRQLDNIIKLAIPSWRNVVPRNEQIERSEHWSRARVLTGEILKGRLDHINLP